MDEAMINKVTEPECWHSLASQSFGTHSYLLGTCQFGPGSGVIFAVPLPMGGDQGVTAKFSGLT